MISDKLFKLLRALSEYVIVAIGSFYLGLAQIWELPFGDKISDSCVLLATFVGVIVNVLRAIYEKENSYKAIEEELVEDTQVSE